MNAFVAIRYATFALFLLFSVLTGSFSALNLGYLISGYVSKPSVVAESLDTYLVALSLIHVLFLLPVIAIELCRKGALTSRIWFELVWISVFFMAYLGGAIAATILIPGAICHADTMSKMMCMASTGLIAFAWISTSLHFLYFLILLVYTIIRSRHEFGTWNSSIIDQPAPAPSIPPVMVTHTYSRSVDGPIGNVHHISFAGASQDDRSPEEEKKFRHADLAQPTFTLNPGLNGPPTFGNAGFGRNGDLERGRTRTRNTGSNAIGQAPVHRGYQLQKHPYRTSGAFEPSSASSAGADHSQHPSKQPPWLSGEETPSPAVIRTASKTVVAPPSVSLYPVHVVNAGLTTVPVKPNTPTAKSTLSGFLQVKRQNSSQSKTSLPYLNSSRGSSQRTLTSNVGHSQSHSIDSFIQESDASSTNTIMGATHQRNRSDESDKRPRRKRMEPRHRPPPLNLSGLSNIANAERRK